jgi:hypothetical protein
VKTKNALPDGSSVFEMLAAIAKAPPKRAGRGTQKGDKRPHWEVDKLWKARRKNARRRTVREFWKRERERLKTADKRNRVREPYRNRDKLLRAMVPGEWHGWADLMRAADMPRNSVGVILSKLRDAGMVLNQDGAWSMTEAGIVERSRVEALIAEIENAAVLSRGVGWESQVEWKGFDLSDQEANPDHQESARDCVSGEECDC